MPKSDLPSRPSSGRNTEKHLLSRRQHSGSDGLRSAGIISCLTPRRNGVVELRERPVAEPVTVLTAEKDREKRHFILVDGRPQEVGSYEEGFGRHAHRTGPRQDGGYWRPDRFLTSLRTLLGRFRSFGRPKSRGGPGGRERETREESGRAGRDDHPLLRMRFGRGSGGLAERSDWPTKPRDSVHHGPTKKSREVKPPAPKSKPVFKHVRP